MFDPVVRGEIGTRIKRVSHKLRRGWPNLTAGHPLGRIKSGNSDVDDRDEKGLLMAKKKATAARLPTANYSGLLGEVVSLLEAARRMSARAVNTVMTATYWEIGRRIVEVEQRGEHRAGYGDELIQRLATDLTARFGRGSAPSIFVRCVVFSAFGQNSRFSRRCLLN